MGIIIPIFLYDTEAGISDLSKVKAGKLWSGAGKPVLLNSEPCSPN